MKDKELRRRLIEDVESSEEAERLLPMVHRLQQWHAPLPTSQDTIRLLETLASELPMRNTQRASRVAPSSFYLRHSVLLLRAQLRVVRNEIWAASGLVMVLGALVTLATYGPGAPVESLPFVLIAPVVAAVGVTFLYGAPNDPAIEVELATPVSSRTILLARLALLYGFNLALGLAASGVLAALLPDLSLWPLVMTWLAPMAFLSALTFLLNVIFVESPLSILIGVLLWMVQGLKQVLPAGSFSFVAYWPDLLAPEARPFLWMLALALGGVAVWLAGREEHWIGRSSI